jgi:uncharacterized RDD family membrane protein YckC
LTFPGGELEDAVNLPAATAGTDDRNGPVDRAAYGGLRRRRIAAWAIDAAICFLLTCAAAIPATFLGLLSFGLLWGPAWLLVALVPLVYHATLVSGSRRSTWGQRLMGLRFETPDGRQAGFLQAGAHWVLFYLSVGFTAGLILVWTLFNPNKSLIHDLAVGLEARRTLPRSVA